MSHIRGCRRLLLALVCVMAAFPVVAADEPNLTKEQIKQFLTTAQVTKSTRTSKGITVPWHLTLSDGSLTHDASFQSVDEHTSMKKFADGRVEMNFVDSYKYNIAAYVLAELLGMDDMLPVTVERKWKGETGSISWWLPVVMDEADRLKKKLSVPDPDAWNNQMYKIRVFDQLVYDTDPNLTNVLISADWKIWRVDFSRAFRTSGQIQSTKDLVRCERHLWEKLKALDGNEFAERTKKYLTKSEVKGVMERRDKVVAYFQKLIAEKGEGEVLY